MSSCFHENLISVSFPISLCSWGLCAVGSEMVMVDGVHFPAEIPATKPLSLLGHGMFCFSSGLLPGMYFLLKFHVVLMISRDMNRN